MRLTRDNYFSMESNRQYMSSTQFKAFQTCEAAALAEINGEYTREPTVSLLVGSYVDAHFSGTLDEFRERHPEIYKQRGGLKSEYVQADQIIERIERDPYFLSLMKGRNQAVMTGEIGGVPFKIRMDSYFPGECIVDLKIMRDFKPVWKEGEGKVPFVEAWGYDIQGAIYRAVEGNNLPFLIAAATKEPVTDIAVIELPDYLLDAALKLVENDAERYAAIKRGEIAPMRCERCDYCKATKVLIGSMPYERFIMEDAGVEFDQ